MRAYFVAGTDTGVGKTVMSAGLMRYFASNGTAHYWKPVQTGAVEDDDTTTVRSICAGTPARFHEPCYRFRAPLSPHLAAAREGATIDGDELSRAGIAHLAGEGTLLVEGAGGCLVPLAPGLLQLDFVQRLGIPVLLVAHDRLGAINHTLLSLEACRSRGIAVAGVILNRAGELEGNGESIERFGRVRILARIPEMAGAEAAARALESALRGSSL